MKIGTTDIKEIFLGTTEVKRIFSETTPIWAKMTVYFDENTGSSVNNKTVYYKRAYGTLPTTSKTGHTFNGWFTDETWGTEVTEETICNQVDNHTLYAKLDINYYTITFKNYQGSVVDTQSVPYGSTPSTPSGTADTAQYEYSWPTINPATKNITYQETRTVKSYTVTWKAYNNQILKNDYLTYGSVSTAPTGTSDTAQYEYSWPKSSTTVIGNETIQETRALKYYTVTWKDWNGIILQTQMVAYGGSGTPPANPTRTGYTFSGWSGDYTYVTSNVTITATYTINYYTVTWKDWNGTTLKTEPVAYGGNGTPPSQPTRTGYTFSGWSGNYTGITGNVTITATYTINQYTVTFKDWDGTTLKTQTVNYGGNAFPPLAPSRTGYTFIGWSGTYTNVTSNRTITATYTINYYTVTFKDWDGTTLKTQTVAYGSNATPPSNPTRTGYTFSGWSGTYTNVTSNRTITATYTAVNATSWSILGAGNHAYVASFEETSFLTDPTRLGCGFYITDLPSASLYLVGDIVRGRLNSARDGICDSWAYFEAV